VVEQNEDNCLRAMPGTSACSSAATVADIDDGIFIRCR